MISLVVAYTENHVIGKNCGLPWYLPNDLKHFKKVTSGHTIVMGRKTYDSIGRALPNRRNVVLTRNLAFHAPNIEVFHHKEDILALGDIDIIGGAKLFEMFMEDADRLYITEIHANIEGDTFFPRWNHDDFVLISEEPGVLDEKNTLPHTFYVYEHK